MRMGLPLAVLLGGLAISSAQTPGLTVKVTKKIVRGEADDESETIYFHVAIENSGQAAMKDLSVLWTVVLEKEPEKRGASSKPDYRQGQKIVSLRPKDKTTFDTEQFEVSKTSRGFYWEPEKRGDPENWVPHYHGYAVQILAEKKTVLSEFRPTTLQKPIELFEAEHPFKPTEDN